MQLETQPVRVPGGPVLTFTRITNIEDLIAAAQEVDELPFWAELWPSAVGLAAYLWHEVNLQDKTVLELGCGLGLSGIIAAKKGAQVTQTDFIPQALSLAGQNASQNDQSTERIEADWRQFPELGAFSTIIGSDILYEKDLHGSLETIVHKHLAPGGEFIFSDPGRDWAKQFFARFSPDDWENSLTEIPVHLDQKDYAIRIHRWRRR
ncbi:methyltransferase domain-containing protein [Heliobacterium chlorum]|uniref:Methyltransferase domain-containing protein n=1 Tax=Heliobacterium chlorum TaxID=2698 RepID=A0ABR7T5Z2_HELCL|nr:methyltransferase domain-containing protein [Heliobacterium chlorum]MBC9786197.1 methyltransferase domain-containing protein [Heliobacterium chlorum]